MKFYISIVLLCLVKFTAAMETVTVETKVGEIKGYARTIEPFGKPLRVRQFLGIPYAEPPVGALRFQKPVMKRRMDGVYDATNYKPACSQLYIDLLGKRKNGSMQYSNDCLVLNIYTPDNLGSSVKVPVMIVIHGGGFVVGSSNIYSGHITSAYGNVVVVTINYRLGLFGFLSTGDSNLPGNYGLWDQHMAIRWVHENIAAFGGDPEQVTLIGGSAGGASVIFQAMYPGNKGLFKRIIPQSGSITCPWAYQRDSLKNAKRMANIVGCATDVDSSQLASCLRKIPDEAYMEAMNNPANNYRRFPLEFVVSVDGEFVPLSTWGMLHSEVDIAKARRRFFRSIDVIAGLVEDEGHMMITPFVGVDNTDTFSTNRSNFENELVPEIIRVMYGENIPDSIRAVVVSEYTNWNDPENNDNTYDSFIRLSSDYVFNSHTIDITKIHATKDGDNSNTYLYMFNALPSQHILWVPPTWKRGSVHADEWAFILGYDSDTGFTSATAPYGQEPEEWEIEMSKVVIKIWTNFAKSGDPNKPESIPVVWPKFTLEKQLYLNISRDMSVGERLFERGYNFWTNVLPELVKMTKPENTIEKKLYCDKNGDCPP
ncbi:bile salt-activated lipase-like [Mercenaria mercenaria]|uniref:bile salt-activated lipase-like n=1 Tax=Mercenaria mercenaria TaxID=6596 RepID=UPI00234FB31F|nr:bile salt-activated lipase-like [Mercenaria mercenaria]